MPDALFNNLRLGYPKESLSEGSYKVLLEYVGERETLAGSINAVGEKWEPYLGYVSLVEFEDIEGTDPVFSIMRVNVETKQGSADYPAAETGNLDETNEERDWVVVQRSMWEHPAFRVNGGGQFALTTGDVEEIKAWMEEEDVDKKAAYEYKPKGFQDGAAYYRTLTDNGIMFAKGIQYGIEYYNDYAPVVRKTSTYTGGPPPSGQAGKKEEPPPDLALPDYEYIKSADRSLKSGGQTKFRRDEEWLGAAKVLVDKDNIYWQ